MPRRSRSSSAPRSPSQTQTRQSSTMAAPAPTMASRPAPSAPTAAPTAPVAAAPQQPGLFAQMATTAAGVAVGSAVGHTISNGISSLFSGSSSDSTPQQSQPAYVPQQHTNYYSGNEQVGNTACQADLKAFTNCMDTSQNDITQCQFYLDMLKQCQSFAASR